MRPLVKINMPVSLVFKNLVSDTLLTHLLLETNIKEQFPNK
jgi:hypothetical protein